MLLLGLLLLLLLLLLAALLLLLLLPELLLELRGGLEVKAQLLLLLFVYIQKLSPLQRVNCSR